MTKVYIDGSAGTTGLRIYDRLRLRSDIDLLEVSEERRKDAEARRELINRADIVFLCLPDEAARESVALCTNPDTRIIDASTAHRTQPGWAYGFPELSPGHRSAIKEGHRVCVPGCHAGGFLSLVYPLVAGGLISPGYPLSAHSVTGYSGGGKGMIANYEGEGRDDQLGSPAQYGLGATHKHLKEMTAVPGLTQPPVFNPIVASFYSGMVVTVPLFPKLMKMPAGVDALFDFFAGYYAHEPLIHVMKHQEAAPGGFLYANALSGRDDMQIIIGGNDERPQLMSRFCNLGKGASGAAVQCMNLMLGCPENAGLNV